MRPFCGRHDLLEFMRHIYFAARRCVGLNKQDEAAAPCQMEMGLETIRRNYTSISPAKNIFGFHDQSGSVRDFLGVANVSLGPERRAYLIRH
jgi:hypothetical protein